MRGLLRVYGTCLARTPRSLVRSAWVLLLPIVYAVVFLLAARLTAPLGLVGGFIMGFVEAAIGASALYVLDEIVSGSPVRPRELLPSARRYLWPVVNVLFVFWIAGLVLDPLLERSANGEKLSLALWLVLAVLLNATPEVIYQKRLYGGIATLQESVRFIQRYWVEWLIPNALFIAALWYGLPYLFTLLPFSLGFTGILLAEGLLTGALLLPIMVFRGFLFHALEGGALRRARLNLG